MIGAIIGDIAGSVYEWHNIKTKEFPFFRDDCCFTDDTVMTVAVAEALLNGGGGRNLVRSMKKYGRQYPDAGYGGRFMAWLQSDRSEPYNSWGNGSAMRVSPVGFFVPLDEDAEAVRTLAAQSAAVTHNHPEGIKGAQAIAEAIWFLRRRRREGADPAQSRDALRGYLSERYDYDLSRTLDAIRPGYRFDVSCQGSVPEAIIAFLESTGFEDAVRNAISIGGDSDTIAAITGGIAEAAYGVPRKLRDRAWEYLTNPLRSVLRRWQKTVPRDG